MDPNYNQVRVRGANVPVNTPQDAPQPPPTNPYYPYPGEDPYQPSEQASSWEPVKEWLQQPPFSGSMWDPIKSGYSNFENWWAENMYGRTPGGGGLSGAGDLLKQSFNNMLSGAGSAFSDGRQEGEDIVQNPFTDSAPAQEIIQEPSGLVAGPTTNQQGQTFSDRIAANQFDGSPYDQAADYMMERREAQMRAVQDMYNQYAAETQANVDRIGDIYGGASAGVGQTYDSATGNIQDAYGSAQQQAADQMARLGIEEAAPTVINPMALSQAEDLSSLETNRASTLGATEQFGATAGGFASDMATVAQQGALENQRGATEQLADQLFELEMQRAEAQQAYNPYQRAMQELEAEQAFEQFYNPQPDPGAMQDQAEFLYRQEQDDVTNFNRRVDSYAEGLGGDLESRQQTAYEAAMKDAQTGMFGPRLKAEADQYFAGRQAGQ